MAAGAVVEGEPPVTVWNSGILGQLGLGAADLAATVDGEVKVIAERRAAYLAGREAVPVEGRDVVVVDDGIATGATVKAALKALSGRGVASLTLAVPLAPEDTLEELRPLVDHIVCLKTPSPFFAVGQGYERFGQTSDAEVVALLKG